MILWQERRSVASPSAAPSLGRCVAEACARLGVTVGRRWVKVEGFLFHCHGSHHTYHSGASISAWRASVPPDSRPRHWLHAPKQVCERSSSKTCNLQPGATFSQKQPDPLAATQPRPSECFPAVIKSLSKTPYFCCGSG